MAVKRITTEQELDGRIVELQVAKRTRVRNFLKKNYEMDRDYVIAIGVLVTLYVIGAPLMPEVWGDKVREFIEGGWNVIPVFVLAAAAGRIVRYRTIRPTDDV